MTIRGINQQRHDIPQAGLTWVWNEVPYLHKGNMGFNQFDWPNPVPPFRIEQTTTVVHVQFTGKDTLPFRNQYPPPIGPAPIEQTTTWSQTRMFGQDKLPKNQSDWPLPSLGTSDPPSRRSWEWRQTGQLGQGTPQIQTDWPVPISYEPNPRRSWEWRQVGYQGQDKLPIRNLYPNPDPVNWYKDWALSLLQNTLIPAATTPFPIAKDWPNPTPVTWYQSWSWRQVDKIGLDTLPFRQQDWPNPTPVNWYKSVEFTLGPNTLLPPFRQSDWPLPQPAQWYRSIEGAKTPVISNPFVQLDWPNPQPVQWYREWAWNQLRQLGQDKLPFNQKDWPLPYPVQWYQALGLNLLQGTLIPAPSVPPFLNFDWPNPRDYSRLNDYGYISFVVNPPLPVPPITPQGGGWTEWTEVDVQNQAAFWKKTAKLENYYQNIRTAAQELGKKGGEARMKTMTAFERQSYAKAAAQARWGKK